MIATYRRKSPILRAVQWTGHNFSEIADIAGPDFDQSGPGPKVQFMCVFTGSGRAVVRQGDWVVAAAGAEQHVRVFSDAGFRQNFERCENA